MTKGHTLILFVLLLSTGCAQYPSSSYHEVDFTGTIERVDGEFQMDGTVMIVGGATTDQNFSSVSVTLYTAEKTAYRSIDLGRFSTRPDWGPTEKQINVTTPQQPKYVLVESDEFWDSTNIKSIGFVWNDSENHYDSYIIQKESERFGDK